MNEAHDRLVRTETDLRESHRKQIQELNQRHNDDIEEQMNTMTEDFKKKEAYLKEQSKTNEERYHYFKITLKNPISEIHSLKK
jgi:centrobin